MFALRVMRIVQSLVIACFALLVLTGWPERTTHIPTDGSYLGRTSGG
jgi:hypothetical protein